MSWSVTAIGKASAVKKAVAKQFVDGGKCMEPEETIRQSVATTIDTALGGFDADAFVQVSASGSQGYLNYSEKTGVFNSLTIEVKPLFGLLVE